MSRRMTGERIGVLGLARSGVAAARLAIRRGASVYASDAADSEATRAAAEEIRRLGGKAETGRHDLEKLAACDRIVLSPGIPPLAAVLMAPELADVEIIPELEFAYEQLDAPVIVVTGTNGKTTVTALAEHVLRAAGVDAAAGGNIGTALSEIALRDPQPEVAVVEASSFQLGRVRNFSPAIGVLTNLAPDHLDWYPGVAEYYADKAKMFDNATPASRWVLNAEDEVARELPGEAEGERYYFRVESDPPPGERGGFLDGEGTLRLRIGEADEPLLQATELRILGSHNAANALAAAIAARLVGAEAEGIARGLATFGALEHRLEPVAEPGGVLWINDSKATNVASTQVALRSVDRPLILLLGGKHKGEAYPELIPDIRGRVRQVIVFGEAADRIEAALAADVPLRKVGGSFADVLRHAARDARPGDAVLLSPACSSYDMFRDYEDRGRQFRAFVQEELG